MAAQIFTIAGTTLNEADEMTGEEAAQRMLDDARARLLFEERMAAITSVFGQSVPSDHAMHAMSEQIAEVAHFLLECYTLRVWIALGAEKQRMPTLAADVFPMAFSFSYPDVAVTEQEAGDSMTDPRDLSLLVQIILSTMTMLDAALHGGERYVTDPMTE